MTPELIDTLIKVYFSLNIFFAGYYFGDSHRDVDDRKALIFLILFCVGIIFFGLPLIILDFTQMGLRTVYNKLNSIFQISFFFTYYFTKKWDSLAKDKLKTINNISNLKDDKTLKNRIYKYCTTLINKRNNYIPVPDAPDVPRVRIEGDDIWTEW